jgi:hypothetical protein
MQVGIDLHINDFATTLTQKVGVWLGATVIVHVALVDAQNVDGMARSQQLERVVDCGAREGGHSFPQVNIDGFGRGVGVMLHEIFHDCHTLHRGAYAMRFEMLGHCFHLVKNLTDFKFKNISFLKSLQNYNFYNNSPNG